MYDDLVKRLRNRRTCIQQSGSLEDFPLLCEAADAIEELNKPRWIPVTERLPPKKEIYWCYTNQGLMCECRWTNDRYGLGASDVWGWNVMDVPQYQKVTHWMPLPEPPKEE